MAITPGGSKRSKARITRQGQITVPKHVRDALDLAAGDELEFELERDRAIVRPRRRRSLLEFAGVAASAVDRIPPTAEGIDALIKGAATRSARRRRG